MKNKQTENEVKNDISQWLSWHKISHRRINSGGFYGEYKGKERFYKFVSWLWPKDDLVILDIHGWHKGRFFEIECKAPGKKPNESQKKTISYFQKIGIISFYADSHDMFIKKWEMYNDNPT